MKDSPRAKLFFYMLLIHFRRKHPILHLFTPRSILILAWRFQNLVFKE
uniref:Uncharacterized protein n=1 Tax=Arundo donax TaxID=35708 RepID=A0A0A9NSS4_ARUDO